MVALPEAGDEDVAALDQADARFALVGAEPAASSTSATQGPAALTIIRARDGAAAGELGGPGVAVAAGGEQFGAGGDLGAALVRVERVEDDQPGIVDPGVPIGGEPEAAASAARGSASRCRRRRERGRLPRPGEQIVEAAGRAGSSRSGRPPGGSGRTNCSGRTMCGAVREQDLALVQRFADQPELVLLEIAQAAVDQLRRGRAGMAGEIVLLDQQHVEPAPGGVAGDRRAVDAAADDRGGRSSPCAPLLRHSAEAWNSSHERGDWNDRFGHGTSVVMDPRFRGDDVGERMGDTISRHRCGHDQHARDAVRARTGRASAREQRELTQHYPRPGWVEHDAGGDLGTRASPARGRWSSRPAARSGSRRSASPTSARRSSSGRGGRGEPLAPAIVWQDRRTAELCARLKEAGHEAALQAKTGLLLDPYFSASKIAWALRAMAAAARGGRRSGDRHGRELAGLQADRRAARHRRDQRLAHRADGHPRAAAGTRACSTCSACRRGALPEIVDCAGRFRRDRRLFGAPIPICGMAGDQQAAAIGQACFAPGDTKATYGTGAFVLTHTGDEAPVSRNRLLTTIAWQLGGERRYALEGSVFVAGSLIQWLRDALGLIATAAESEALARSVAGQWRRLSGAGAWPGSARRTGGPRRAARSPGSASRPAAPISSAPRWRRWRTRPTI